MAKDLQTQLQDLKDLFTQIREGTYVRSQRTLEIDKRLAYSEFEAKAAVLEGNYLRCPEEQAQPLLRDLKEIVGQFKSYTRSSADKLQSLRNTMSSLSLSQPKCTRDMTPLELESAIQSGEVEIGYGGELIETHIKGDGHVNPYKRT